MWLCLLIGKTTCLLETGDFSRKLRLRCSFQFPWCVLALRHVRATKCITAHASLTFHPVSQISAAGTLFV
jgi:hypothetical protein